MFYELRRDSLRNLLVMFIYYHTSSWRKPDEALAKTGGEEGIRTLAPSFESSHLAGEHF